MKSPSDDAAASGGYTPPRPSLFRRFLKSVDVWTTMAPDALGWSLRPPPAPHRPDQPMTSGSGGAIPPEPKGWPRDDDPERSYFDHRMEMRNTMRHADFSYLEIGDRVAKTGGYRFPGEVRAVITKRDGRIVYAVECTAPDCEGMLHIFSRDQIRRV